jgi:hypothetical protein|tara:strand:+ start:372 stop:608 length:237 start_codon:yes stop_codon:yes gene_type:complete
MPMRLTQAAKDRAKAKEIEDRLYEESIRLEEERRRREEKKIQRQMNEGVFKGADGGKVSKLRSGGRVDGCAIRGKTRA